MRLESGRGIRYTFEVEREVCPTPGDRYRDLRGHVWIVEDVGPATIALRDPPPTHPMWNVTFRGEHVAYPLAVGEPLEAIQETRMTPPITGQLRSDGSCTGFGTVHARGAQYSWMFRLVETDTPSWLLCVGPLVPSYSFFNEVLFERRGVYVPTLYELPWDLVTSVLQEFIREHSVP